MVTGNFSCVATGEPTASAVRLSALANVAGASVVV